MCHAKTKMDSPDVKPFKNRIGTKTTATGGTVSFDISNRLPLREPVEWAGEWWWRRVVGGECGGGQARVTSTK